jgi:hypothetical protein
MGIDAVIRFESTVDEPDLEWFHGGEVEKIADDYYDTDGGKPTHEVDLGGHRYYGKGYERGPWPTISAILLVLLMSKDVKKVWYGGDCNDWIGAVDIDWLNEMNKYYVEYGHRPYRRDR